MGARVIAAASSDAKLQVCKENGADELLTEILATMGEWASSGGLWRDALFSFGNYFLALLVSLVVGLALDYCVQATALDARAARTRDQA